MKINMDVHIHSKYSCDSESSIESICVSAIEKGLKYICITDHVDFNKNDYGYNYYNAQNYFEDLNIYKVKYKDQLTVLSGLEFSEPQLYKDEFNKLKSLGYDMIIGSIHWLGDSFIGQRKLLERNKDEVQREYFIELLKMINESDINTVGHLDRPKIVLNEMPLIKLYIDEILESMILKNIALEMNTRAYRKGWSELMPSAWIIQKYLDKGGDMVVVGSDAHVTEEIGAGYTAIHDICDGKLARAIGIFKQGKFTRLSDGVPD